MATTASPYVGLTQHNPSSMTGAQSTGYVPPNRVLETDPLTIKRRCAKCQGYYVEKDNAPDACVHHPGDFDPEHLHQPKFLAVWTCCKGLKNDEGCARGRHRDDLATASVVATHFPRRDDIDPTGVYSEQVRPQLYPSLSQEQNNNNIIPGYDPRYLIHTVVATDTLPGVALRYSVTVADLARLNGVSASSIHIPHKSLKIPEASPLSTEELKKAQADSQAQMTESKQKSLDLRKLRSTFKIDENEAKFYLEENNWKYEEAKKALEADLEWEKSQAGKR